MSQVEKRTVYIDGISEHAVLLLDDAGHDARADHPDKAVFLKKVDVVV